MVKLESETLLGFDAKRRVECAPRNFGPQVLREKLDGYIVNRR